MPNLARELREEEEDWRRQLKEAGRPEWSGTLEDAFTWTTNSRTRIHEELTIIRSEYRERYGAWFQKGELKLDDPPKREHSHNLIAVFTGIGGVFAAFLEALL